MRSASRSSKFGVTVSRHLCSIDGGGRSAKFGGMVFKASMVDYWGVDLPGRSAKYELPDV